MNYEQGEWIMMGVSEDSPLRIKTPEELIECVDEFGFLPLFRNDIPGFSVEERTAAQDWWSDDAERDPWQWREIIAESGRAVYGKFFDKKAGFVSLQWFPAFANCRRSGYDFDARWDDGKANIRAKKIMDIFSDGGERYSYEIKRLAGFGAGGEKNFEGCMTELQMQTYLVVRDFRCRRNRHGEPYGWPTAVYTMPESRWGSAFISAGYEETPQQSFERISEHLKTICPGICDKQIKKLLR